MQVNSEREFDSYYLTLLWHLFLPVVHSLNKDLWLGVIKPTATGLLLITVTTGIISPWITSLVQANKHWGKSQQIYRLHRTSISQIKPNSASNANSQLTATIHRGQRSSGALDWVMGISWQELAAFFVNLWPANSAGWRDRRKTVFLLFLFNPCVEELWTGVEELCWLFTE